MKSVIITFSIVLLYSSCFKKQNNTISAPETPVYNMHGEIINSLTLQPVENVHLLLKSAGYYGDFNAEQLTDENGYFNFSLVPGGNGYSLIVAKESFDTLAISVNVNYEDKNTGSIILSKQLEPDTTVILNFGGIRGMDWFENSIWIVTQNSIVELAPDYTVKQSISITGFTPTGLAHNNAGFWTADTSAHVLINFTLLNADSLKIHTSYLIPENPFNTTARLKIKNLYYSNGYFYATAENIGKKYARFIISDNSEALVFTSPSPLFMPYSVCGYNDILLLLTWYYQEKRIYLTNLTDDTNKYGVITTPNGYMTTNGVYLYLAINNLLTLFEIEPYLKH